MACFFELSPPTTQKRAEIHSRKKKKRRKPARVSPPMLAHVGFVPDRRQKNTYTNVTPPCWKQRREPSSAKQHVTKWYQELIVSIQSQNVGVGTPVEFCGSRRWTLQPIMCAVCFLDACIVLTLKRLKKKTNSSAHHHLLFFFIVSFRSVVIRMHKLPRPTASDERSGQRLISRSFVDQHCWHDRMDDIGEGDRNR